MHNAASFEVTLAKAPTGEFQINFALNDTVPSGSKAAVFVIKDDEGNVLNGKVIDEDIKTDSLGHLPEGILYY